MKEGKGSKAGSGGSYQSTAAMRVRVRVQQRQTISDNMTHGRQDSYRQRQLLTTTTTNDCSIVLNKQSDKRNLPLDKLT